MFFSLTRLEIPQLPFKENIRHFCPWCPIIANCELIVDEHDGRAVYPRKSGQERSPLPVSLEREKHLRVSLFVAAAMRETLAEATLRPHLPACVHMVHRAMMLGER